MLKFIRKFYNKYLKKYFKKNKELQKLRKEILDIEKEMKKLKEDNIFWGFLVICVSLFYKVLVQINSVFKFYHKMSNCCISILNRQCSFFCDIFNC